MALTYLPASQANAAIGAMITASTTYYESLHTTTCSNTGSAEVSGGSYGRQTIQVGAASSGVMTSTTAQNFTNMPSATVDYFGFWTLVTAGTFLLGGQLASSLTVPAGATVAVAIGGITLSVQG
jgi:hypothetical protein